MKKDRCLSKSCMPTIEIDGHRFYYYETGVEKPTILMLCSTGLDSRQWENVSKILPNRHLIGLHYLGYFPSEEWDKNNPPNINIDYMAAEYLLLQEEGEVDILGHSYGGFLALKLAIGHPNKIRKISLHEPIVWGCLDHTDKDELKNEFGSVVETFFTEGLGAEDFLEDFVDYWNKPTTWAQMSENRKKNWRTLQPKILAEVRLLCYDKTDPAHWRQVKHPVLMTYSKDTPSHHLEACRILSLMIPNIITKEVPGGHM